MADIPEATEQSQAPYTPQDPTIVLDYIENLVALIRSREASHTPETQEAITIANLLKQRERVITGERPVDESPWAQPLGYLVSDRLVEVAYQYEPDEIDQLVASHQLFSISVEDSATRLFPIEQFDEEGSVIPSVSQLAELLLEHEDAIPPYMIVTWLNQHIDDFKGDRPWDLLKHSPAMLEPRLERAARQLIAHATQ